MAKHNSGSYYVKTALKAGLRVVNGRGDHVKIYGDSGRGFMTVPLHRELATGTESAIRKWFRSLGILCLLVVPLMCLLVALVAP